MLSEIIKGICKGGGGGGGGEGEEKEGEEKKEEPYFLGIFLFPLTVGWRI